MAPSVRAKTDRRAAIPNSIEPAPMDVARRAYEIYCARGAEHGHDIEDWLRAESELRGAAEIRPRPTLVKPARPRAKTPQS
jgi:DUF2934 family protein